VVPEADSTDEQIAVIDRELQTLGQLQPGDKVVIIAGTPIGIRGTTNMMKLHTIGAGGR
jgi:pyruvate kinase